MQLRTMFYTLWLSSWLYGSYVIWKYFYGLRIVHFVGLLIDFCLKIWWNEITFYETGWSSWLCIYANHLFHNAMKCLAQALISVVYLRLTAKLHFMGSNKKPKQRLRCGNYNYQLFTVKCRRFIDEGREE